MNGTGMTRFIELTDTLIKELQALNHPPCALLIEDDPLDAELMATTLEQMGVKVSVANTGDKAIRVLEESLRPTNPDLNIVFLDLRLPGTDGPEILKRIRQLAPCLPVIVVTGAVDSPMIAEAAKCGYIGLVEKPLHKVDVQEILRMHQIKTPPPQ